MTQILYYDGHLHLICLFHWEINYSIGLLGVLPLSFYLYLSLFLCISDYKYLNQCTYTIKTGRRHPFKHPILIHCQWWWWDGHTLRFSYYDSYYYGSYFCLMDYYMNFFVYICFFCAHYNFFYCVFFLMRSIKFHLFITME